MSVVSNEFQTLLGNARTAFTNKYTEYGQKISAINNDSANRKNTLKQLNTQFDSQQDMIVNSMLRQKFKDMIQAGQVNGFGVRGDYARFVYYVTRLNEMNHSSFVIKYNPYYCQTILKTMATDYLILKKNLEVDLLQIDVTLKKDYDTAYQAYKAQMDGAYGKLMMRATDLAQKEANRIIQEIKSKA